VDQKQRTISKTYTRKELEGMSVQDLADLVVSAGPGAKFYGTAVVRGPDGKVKYDRGAVPGKFGESPEELEQK